MRIVRIVPGLVLVAVLVGCTVSDPTTTSSPTPSETTPAIEVAPLGEAAIPLGCADILDTADVASLGADFDEELVLAIDENRIVIRMDAVAALQSGALHCIWAARYGSTDFHAQIELRISPSTSTTLDPTAEQSYADAFAPLDGDPTTLIACGESFIASSDDPTLYNGCDVVQLRDGYRIELTTNALEAVAGRDQTVARRLVASIGAAVDGAGPARAIAPFAGTSDPAALCTAPELAPLLEHVGAGDEPAITTGVYDPAVTTCDWKGVDDYGQPTGPWVNVLPGGAWAIPRLATGFGNIFVSTHPSADGTFIVGTGDAVSAWRAIGDDLVEFEFGGIEAVEGWEEFLDATW
jgi:hypothetical protein